MCHPCEIMHGAKEDLNGKIERRIKERTMINSSLLARDINFAYNGKITNSAYQLLDCVYNTNIFGNKKP